MWIIRRRIEVFFLLVAAALMCFALRLPPPIADTFVFSGPVRHLEVTTGKHDHMTFSVAGKSLDGGALVVGHRRVLSHIYEGAQAEVVAWTWLGDPSIVQMSLDGRRVVRRDEMLFLYWVRSLGLMVLGGLLFRVVRLQLRRKETAAELLERGGRIAANRRAWRWRQVERRIERWFRIRR
jgi:hypothetical protein